jgi:hypothetical protein
MNAARTTDDQVATLVDRTLRLAQRLADEASREPNYRRRRHLEVKALALRRAVRRLRQAVRS